MAIDNVTVKKIVIPDRFKPVLGASGFYFHDDGCLCLFCSRCLLAGWNVYRCISLSSSIYYYEVLRWYLSLYLEKSIYPFPQSWR